MRTSESKQCSQYKIFQSEEFPVLVLVSRGENHANLSANSHPELEFHLICHGNSQYMIDGVNYSCEKNSILIMHENEPHAWICDQDCSDENISLIFDPKVLEGRKIARAAFCRIRSLHHILLSNKQTGIAEFLLSEIAEECKHQELHWQEVVIEYLETFLAVLYRAADGQVPTLVSNNSLVQNIIDYMEDKFTTKLSLVDIAEHFNMSPYALSKKFKQHMGFGFREYLIHRRIVAAQKMLKETDFKVAAIASKVGFDSLTTFNRDFRMLTGIAPAVYRSIASEQKSEP